LKQQQINVLTENCFSSRKSIDFAARTDWSSFYVVSNYHNMNFLQELFI
jgi:hypothetical protein